MKNSDRNVHPVTYEPSEGLIKQCEAAGMPAPKPNTSGGITLREHFAGLAMASCRSRHSDYNSWQELALDAVDMADALLKELEK